MKAAFGLLVATTGITALATISAPAARAACLSGDPFTQGTDCATFEAGQSATAKVVFVDSSLTPPNANPNFQIGFATNGGTALNITNLKWSSTQNGTYQTLADRQLSHWNQ